jgi:peptidoglycan/LPS O-acetylase OafA/YrhL
MYIFHFMFAWYGVEYVHSKLGYIGRPLILIGAYYVATVALAYLVAAVSERYIEKPGIAYGKRIIRGMDAAKEPAGGKVKNELPSDVDLTR